MKAMKITLHGGYRIRVDFPYDPVYVQKIKTIPDSLWSNTLKAWHIPYTKEAFSQLKKLFPDLEIVGETNTQPRNHSAVSTTSDKSEKTPQVVANTPEKIAELEFAEIQILVSNKNISVKMPENEIDIQFMRSFKHLRWSRSMYCWIIPNYKDNLQKLKAYFGTRKLKIKEVGINNSQSSNNEEQFKLNGNDLLVINTAFKTLRLYFKFNQALSYQIKKIPYSCWNSERQCWEVPYATNLLKEVKRIALEFGYQLKYQEEKKPAIQPRKSRYDIKNYRKCPQEFINKLIELRYSKHTLDSYTDLFEEFINFYEEIPLNEIDENQITNFILYLVNERKVSSSYQNQSINAIKFYYEKVQRGIRKIYVIDRPREEKTLPEILSEEEVATIIRVTENLKHKAIIMTIYSGGLRISELINLKIKDIDSNRMQIRVEQAKGKKDRYTILSQTTLEILRKYVKEYKPKLYMFEGSDWIPYSTSSIYQMFRVSIKKAGILKQVSIHTLRHSFATHLLESGVSTRYIQSLLGHESSKTTEIYTHITTKGFNQIINPLDKLKNL